MAFRHVGRRTRSQSSGSSSSSASASPSSVPALNFTLYGAPAPRSAHRTSSGAAKAKPRRRCTKPTPPPPTSPLGTSRADHNFRLDLSSLECEEELTMISDGSNVYCSQGKVDTNPTRTVSRIDGSCKTDAGGVTPNECRNEKDESQHEEEKQWNRSDEESERNLFGNSDSLTNSCPDSTRSSDKSSGIQTSSYFDSSSQGLSDELPTKQSDSTRSCVSNSSSYKTLSEYSVGSYSSSITTEQSSGSSPSCRSEDCTCNRNQAASRSRNVGHFRKTTGCKTDIIERTMKPVTSPRKRTTRNNDEKIAIQEGNFALRPEHSEKETSTQSSSGVVSNCSTDLESQTKVLPCDGESVNVVPIESKAEQPDNVQTLQKESDLTTTGTKSLIPHSNDVKDLKRDVEIGSSCNHIDFDCSENDERSHNEGSDGLSSPELYGYFCLNRDHETPSEEWTIEEETMTDEVCLCCAGHLEVCACTPNNCQTDFEIDGSTSRSITNSEYCVTSDDCSRDGNCFHEQHDEILIDVEISPQNCTSVRDCFETNSLPPEYNSLPTSGKYISHNKCDKKSRNTFDNSNTAYGELSSGCNLELQRNVFSAPVRSLPSSRVRSSSVLTCDCESGRRTRLLLERLESGYFSDVPVPDIPLSAGEVMEAVLYARQLVCVLERALDRALSFNTNRPNTGSSVEESFKSSSDRHSKRKQRSNSLSPSVIRRCKSMYSSKSAKSKCEKKRNDLVDFNSSSMTRGGNIDHTCNSVGRSGMPRLHSVSPEELQKQKALLKPAAERRLHDAVARVLDMADVLKNAICLRREVLDPSAEEYNCATNRSVSEWSLEDT